MSKGHRLKESFPTRCVPSRAVIWQTHEKHPLTTEENSLRDKGDSCTNIFSMPGLCRTVKRLDLNLLKPSYIKSPSLPPRKIKGRELRYLTSQKSQTSCKMKKSDFACGKFYKTSWHCLKDWVCFVFCFSTSWLLLANTWADLSFSIQITKYPWRAWHSSRTAMSCRLPCAAEWHSYHHLPGHAPQLRSNSDSEQKEKQKDVT